MRKTQRCPKCETPDPVRIPGASANYTNQIPVGFTAFSSVEVVRYVCVECGFSEEWIDDPGDRAKLVAKYGTKR